MEAYCICGLAMSKTVMIPVCYFMLVGYGETFRTGVDKLCWKEFEF